MKIRTRTAFSLSAVLLTCGSFAGGANGAIILSDAGGFAKVTFTAPITFQATVTVSGPPAFFNLIAEDYFTSDTAARNGNAPSGGITTSNFANTILVISTNSTSVPQNLYDRNDLLISFSAGSNINTGDFITFEASSFVSDISYSSLPGTTNSSVSVTMTDNNYQAISGSQTVAVPEPSSAILVGISALALAGLRRRRNQPVERERTARPMALPQPLST